MNDLKYCLQKALQILEIPHTGYSIDVFLDKHTDPHSMLAMSDFFDTYKIENTAGEFDNKPELINYPDPHISQLINNDKSYFVVVTLVKQNIVTYYDEGKKIEESFDEYFKKWTGFVLFFKKSTTSAEPNYTANKQAELINSIKKPLYFFIGLLLIASLIYACFPVFFPFIFSGVIILKITGVIVAILLLSYKYNSESPILKGICNIGKKGSCSNILGTKAANVFSFLSWSEVGLFYFTSTFIALLVFEIFQLKSGYSLILFINALAVPYSFYSVYYQMKIAKSWCILCLSVQALLWLEFFVEVKLWEIATFENILYPIIIFSSSSLFVIAAWYLIKPLLQANTELPDTKRDLKKFKQDISIFNFTLNNQAEIFYPQQADVLRFGSNNPKYHITIFTSPTCAHCSKAHLLIDKLIHNYPNDVAYTSIFAISNDNKDERKQLATHMLQLLKEKGVNYAHSAMNDWYASEKKDKDNWMKKYPVVGNALLENTELIGLHIAIAQNFKIPGTPVISINGKLLPQAYKTDDLEFLIPALLNE